jgi:hypothetical protein
VAAVGGGGCQSVQALQRREAPWRDQEGVCKICGEGFRALSTRLSVRPSVRLVHPSIRHVR